MSYTPPLADLAFCLRHVAGLDDVARLPGCADATPDLVAAALAEAGRLAGEVLAPLNAVGDREHARLENGVVRMPTGFREAYGRFTDGGWASVPFPPEHGGQGLPWLVATAIGELWHSANFAFGLNPLLTQGAVELLSAHGTAEQKARYLPRLVSGEWSGTMNLTEPQAGSDVGALRTRAVREDGHYRITGQKIFITYGDHDLTPNIVHMVLARLPDAPAGSRGVSLFLVPKRLLDADGEPGRHNDLRCVSLEHKLGIHASPTAVMSFGDDGGAIGWLVGEENRGLACMFTMMNNARLAVGLQGLAIAERAWQQARSHAAERRQGRDLVSGEGPIAIADHPDVRRMLMSMRAPVEAMRALVLDVSAGLDRARHEPDAAARDAARARVDLMTPVVKAWCTDLGVEIASTGLQVHGGMGYVEETGAAQHLRDARIAPIYEGTNGIQALDLVARKLVRDGGAALSTLVADMRRTAVALGGAPAADLPRIGRRLETALVVLEDATAWLLDAWPRRPRDSAAGATPYLHLLGTVAGGWMMGRSALAAAALESRRPDPGDPDAEFRAAKRATALYYAEAILPRAGALADEMRAAALADAALAGAAGDRYG